MDESAVEFVTELGVRFRDVDAMGHVNNAVYATYLEQARAEYFGEVVGRPLDDVGTVLVDLHVEYRRPIELADDTVTVRLRVTDVGESSVETAYEVCAGGEVAATAETTQVVIDDDGRPRRVPAGWRERIAARARARADESDGGTD